MVFPWKHIWQLNSSLTFCLGLFRLSQECQTPLSNMRLAISVVHTITSSAKLERLTLLGLASKQPKRQQNIANHLQLSILLRRTRCSCITLS